MMTIVTPIAAFENAFFSGLVVLSPSKTLKTKNDCLKNDRSICKPKDATASCVICNIELLKSANCS